MFCRLDSPKAAFPFLFGGTFIEGEHFRDIRKVLKEFPFLFGGTFIEGRGCGGLPPLEGAYFPSFSEGLSLRESVMPSGNAATASISLPFRRDFH